MKKRASQMQTSLLYGLLGVALLVGAYYLFFTGSGDSVSDTDPTIERLKKDLTSLESTDQRLLTNLDTLLNDPRYDALKQFGELPVEAGKQGRDNPFQQP